MAREKKPVHKVQMTEGKRNIIRQLLEEYDIESAQDIQDALKDLLGGTIKEMMEVEMDDHLGYSKSERSDSDDYRNGYKTKRVNSSYGSMEIEVPQDRKSTFEPQVVKKRQKDISNIDQKIISMYAKGMTTRQISDTLEDIYGFEASEGFISDVTDKIMPQIEDWQNRPLSEVYPVIYIDAIHYSVRDNGVIRKLAAYVILGINQDGYKEVLTIEIGENESAKYWLSVLNGLKNRGVKDILIVCADLKTIYQAPTEEKAIESLERVTEKWSEKYPNSMKSWKQNWDAISPIFKFSADFRKVIYALQYLISTKGDTRNEQYKALALSVSDNMDGKVYAVVKNELDELMKLSNEYFDVRHNDYLNAAKEKREPLNDSQFIEYLYNRAYSILYLLRLKS